MKRLLTTIIFVMLVFCSTVVLTGCGKTYSVTFMQNGEVYSTLQVKKGEEYTLPNNPEKSGYTFNGWYLETSCENKFDIQGLSSIENDLTLYAGFSVNTYTISYVLNGGENSLDNPQTYTVESEAITLKNPTKLGYTFSGWQEGEGVIEKGSIGNKTFTATWQINVYTISYVLNGGENDLDNPQTYTVETETITLKNPVKECYIFIGWEEGNTIEKGSTGNKTFTAKWELPKTCVLTFDAGSGLLNVQPQSVSVTVGESYDLTLYVPTVQGAAANEIEFKYWSLNGSKVEISGTWLYECDDEETLVAVYGESGGYSEIVS